MRLPHLVLMCLVLDFFLASAHGQTFTSGGSVAIPDAPGAGIENAITVSGVYGAPRMRVTLNITHGACDHLDIFLLPPGVNWPGGVATTASQQTAIGAGAIELSTDNLGGGANYTQTQFAIRGDDNFDPSASAAPIASAVAPATGLFMPEGDRLFGTATYFKGVSGSWRLVIIDDTPGVSGVLNSWSIEFGVPSTAEAALLDRAINADYPVSAELVHGATYVVPFAAKTNSSSAIRLAWFNFGATTLNASAASLGNFSNCTATIASSYGLPATQAPGTHNDIVFNVTPTALGNYSFVFTCSTSDANESTYSVTITGPTSSIGVPEIQVERPNGCVLVDGGTDFVGTNTVGASFMLTYLVRNRAAYNLMITQLPMAAPTALVNCTASVVGQPPSSIVAGSNGQFVIEVLPATPGTWSFTWTLSSTDPDESPYDMTVTGTAVAPPPECDVVRGTPIADGSVDPVSGAWVGVPLTLSYVISNTVPQSTLTLGAVVLGATRSNCSATISVMPAPTIAGGANDYLVIELTPSSAGAFSCTVSFANNDPNENPYDWTISGTASLPPAPECGVLRGSLAIADGSQDNLGTLAATVPHTVTYTIENSGNADLSLNGSPLLVVIAAGPNVTASVTMQPAATVSASGTTTIEITYTIVGNGPFDLQVSFDNNDSDENPYNWTVSGLGTAAPEIGVTRDLLILSVVVNDGSTDDIGDNVAGKPATLTYVIANNGNAPLNITLPVVLSGMSNCTATVTTAPNALVPAGTSTVLTIAVTPLTAQPFGFSVSIANDDPNENPYNWTVVGSGTSIGGFKNGSGGGGGCTAGEGRAAMAWIAACLALFAAWRALRRFSAA